MTYRVIITPEALAGVEQFLDYIAIEKQSPQNAERWWRKALSLIETLDHFPQRGPLAPEDASRDCTIRMLIVDRCLFLYTVIEDEQTVRVIGFRHGSQLPRSEELPDQPS